MAPRPYKLYVAGLGDWARTYYHGCFGTMEAAQGAGRKMLEATVARPMSLSGMWHVFVRGPGGESWSAGLTDNAELVEPSPRQIVITQVLDAPQPKPEVTPR